MGLLAQLLGVRPPRISAGMAHNALEWYAYEQEALRDARCAPTQDDADYHRGMAQEARCEAERIARGLTIAELQQIAQGYYS